MRFGADGADDISRRFVASSAPGVPWPVLAFVFSFGRPPAAAMIIVFVFIHFPWWGLKQELILLLEISYVFPEGEKANGRKAVPWYRLGSSSFLVVGLPGNKGKQTYLRKPTCLPNGELFKMVNPPFWWLVLKENPRTPNSSREATQFGESPVCWWAPNFSTAVCPFWMGSPQRALRPNQLDSRLPLGCRTCRVT